MPPRADGLDQFNATVEAFSSHHRVALAYLRTGNLDLASVELERMHAAWQVVVERFGTRRPAEITDQALYTSTLTDISTRIIAVHLVMGLGRPDVAHDALSEAQTGARAAAPCQRYRGAGRLRARCQCRR